MLGVSHSRWSSPVTSTKNRGIAFAVSLFLLQFFTFYVIVYLLYNVKGQAIYEKNIALLLASVICLTFASCGNSDKKDNNEVQSETNTVNISEKKSKAEKAIVGTWEKDGAIITFNSDHTGSIKDTIPEDDDTGFKWKYDEDMDCYLYTLSVGSEVESITVKDDGETSYILIYGDKFYRQNNEQNRHLKGCNCTLFSI